MSKITLVVTTTKGHRTKKDFSSIESALQELGNYRGVPGRFVLRGGIPSAPAIVKGQLSIEEKPKDEAKKATSKKPAKPKKTADQKPEEVTTAEIEEVKNPEEAVKE